MSAAFEWIEKLFSKQAPNNKPDPILVVSGDGFEAVRHDDVLFRVDLDKVLKITAYKKDLITTDLVCFEIEVSEDAGLQVWLIHEELQGFETVDRLFQKLPGYMPDWRDKVIQPAFAANETVIFDRLSPPR